MYSMMMNTRMCIFILLTGFLLVLSACSNSGGGSSSAVASSKVLISIEVTPVNELVHLGTKPQLTATGIYSDNTTENITNLATWSSSSPATVAVSNSKANHGVLTPFGSGTSLIRASLNGVTSTEHRSSLITVSDAKLLSIEITANNHNNVSTMAEGTEEQLTATGIYADNSTQNITNSVVWNSSNSSKISISNGTVVGISSGQSTISATSGNITGTYNVSVTSAKLVSVELTASKLPISIGTTAEFTAIGIFSDKSRQNLTTLATWNSSNKSIASIVNGIATGVSDGTTTISATVGSITGTYNMSVSSATLLSIQITPNNSSLAMGTNLKFTATGIFSNHTHQDLTTSVLWTSSDRSVAAISNASGTQGVATAAAIGSTTITAVYNKVTAITNLTVTAATLQSIAVTANNHNNNTSIAKGTTLDFTATGIYSDGSVQNLTSAVLWISSNTAIATISNNSNTPGLATGNEAGNIVISAKYKGITSNISPTLTVTPAVLVSIGVTANNHNNNPTTAAGYTLGFTATGVYSDNSTQNLTSVATWSSSDTTIATISNANGTQGLATSVEVGNATISAAYNGITSNVSPTLTVTPAVLVSIELTTNNHSNNPTIAAGYTLGFTATGVYSDNSTQNLTSVATWLSSNTATATISNANGVQGLATSIAAGSTTISATYNGIISNVNPTLTVTPAVLVSIEVTANNESNSQIIAAGYPLGFTATGIYSDNSTQNLTSAVTWSSSNTATATISNANGIQGLATSIAAGSTTISATYNGITSNVSPTLTVTPAVLVSIEVTANNESNSPTVAAGYTLGFTATGIYSDNSTQNLTSVATWSSSNTATATISNASGTQGLTTAAEVGNTTISAAYNGITSNVSPTLTVTPAILQSISISSTESSVANGTSTQFSAIGNYSDGSTQNLTAMATWTSSSTVTATISNANKIQGLATGWALGNAAITATYNNITSSALNLQVTAAILQSISISQVESSIASGTTTQFSAIGNYSDGSTQNLTTTATWASSSTATATISNANLTQGLATGKALGNVIITATYNNITSNGLNLQVTPVVLISVQITANSLYRSIGTTTQFSATAVYSDGSTQNVTESSSWQSNSTTVATINSQGIALAISQGSTPIQATYHGVTGQITLNVIAVYAYIGNHNPSPLNPANPVITQCLVNTDTGAISDCTSTGVPFFAVASNMVTDSSYTYVYAANTYGNASIPLLCPIGSGGQLSCSSLNLSSGTYLPFGIAVNNTNTYLYIASFIADSILQCTLASGGNVGTCSPTALGPFSDGATSIVFNNSGNYAYVLHGVGITVSAVNPGNGTLGTGYDTGFNTFFPSGNNTPYNMTFDNAGSAYISDYETAQVIRCTVNPSDGTFTSCGTSSMPAQAAGIVFNSSKTYLYVTTPGNDEVWQCTVSASTNNFLNCISAGATNVSRPVSITFSGAF